MYSNIHESLTYNIVNQRDMYTLVQQAPQQETRELLEQPTQPATDAPPQPSPQRLQPKHHGLP